jgi:hypothetical protein
MDFEQRQLFTQEITERARCPVCLELPASRVYMCSLSHVICAKCLSFLPTKTCPTCRASLELPIRCLHLEQIFNQLVYKCPHDDCNERYILRDREAHQLKCPFAKFTCPDPYCNWKGRFEPFVKHLEKDSHTNCVTVKQVAGFETTIEIPFGGRVDWFYFSTVLLTMKDEIIQINLRNPSNMTMQEMTEIRITAKSYENKQRGPISVRLLTSRTCDPQHQLIFEIPVGCRDQIADAVTPNSTPSVAWLKKMRFLVDYKLTARIVLYPPMRNVNIIPVITTHRSDSEDTVSDPDEPVLVMAE